MMKKGNSVAGRLYYTFGTLFLIAIIAVCSINFTRDGRIFQKPVLTAAAGASGNKAAEGSGDTTKTIKYKKTAGNTGSGTKEKTPATASGTPAKTSKPAPSPTLNPGENP